MEHGLVLQSAEKYLELRRSSGGAQEELDFKVASLMFPSHPLSLSHQPRLQRRHSAIKEKKEKAAHFNQ